MNIEQDKKIQSLEAEINRLRILFAELNAENVKLLKRINDINTEEYNHRLLLEKWTGLGSK